MFSFAGGGWGISYDEYTHHNTPFAPTLNGFGDIYHRYDKLTGKAKDRVQVSMGRLNRCLRRGDKTNKALELGIALESILLSGKNEDGSNGEISFRLANRGAWLLGTDPVDRKKIFSVLKAAYGLRSKAAHEGKVPEHVKVFKGEPPTPTVYLLQDAAMLCSKAIRKIILCGEVPNWTELVLGELFDSDDPK